MFTNVAIVAQPGPELQTIRNLLRNPVRYTVREFLSLDDVVHGLGQYQFEVLLLRLNGFEMPHAQMLAKIRHRFPAPGLVTVSPSIHPNARFQVRDLPRHKLLLESSELGDLARVVDSLAKPDTASAPRMHPRVPRDGDCELVDPEKGTRIKARFLDFAQMGARLQVHPHVPLKRNLRLQLHYRSSSEPSRIHRIELSVVWAQMTGGMVDTIMNGPQQIVGVRFLAAL